MESEKLSSKHQDLASLMPVKINYIDTEQIRTKQEKNVKKQTSEIIYQSINVILFFLFSTLAIYFLIIFFTSLPGQSNNDETVYFSALLRPRTFRKFDGNLNSEDNGELYAVYGQVLLRRDWIWNSPSSRNSNNNNNNADFIRIDNQSSSLLKTLLKRAERST